MRIGPMRRWTGGRPSRYERMSRDRELCTKAAPTPQVVLGGRKVAIRRPRARRAGEEVPLPTARAFANADPLNRRVVDQMLIGVATRQYARSLEPLGADVTTRGTSKRAVSRRVVAQTQAQLDAWRATPLDALDLGGLLIDGVHVGGHCIVVALGIDTMGAKHPLGLWEGATENATVCQGLLTNLGSRGLRTDRSLLVIVDGAKALDTAVTQTVGRTALGQRCQVHKGRNILEHLPEAPRPWVKAVLTRAYTNSHVKTAKRLLQDLARRLDTDYPSAATSVREGLDETLTVLGVGLSERLQRSLATTNAIESLLSRTRHVQRHVKRWRGGTMLHESSRARTMPPDTILTCRCDMTLVGRGRSSDSGSHSRGRPHSPAQLDSGREGHRR